MTQKCKKSQKLIALESELLSVISQKTRLLIICLLQEGPKCLCELAPLMDEDTSTISRHLNLLKDKGVLATKKEGVRVKYWVRDKRVFKILDIVDEILQAEINEKAQILR